MGLRYSRAGQKGLSIAEAVIASFILTAAMVVSAALYHSALQHSVRIDRRHLASRAAERRVEQIRSWSRDQHGTNGELAFQEGWDAFDDTSEPDPEYPGYTVSTQVSRVPLYSPSSEFERINFSAMEDENIPDESTEERQLEDSSYLVTVTASWGPSPKERIVTRTLITDPVRDHGWNNEDPGEDAIKLSYQVGGAWTENAPASINAGNDFYLSAVIKDAHGALVEKPAVQWYIDPKESTGSGTIETLPSSPTNAKFVNEVTVKRNPSGSDSVRVHTGGQVVLVARVRLGGVEAIQKSPPIQLNY